MMQGHRVIECGQFLLHVILPFSQDTGSRPRSLTFQCLVLASLCLVLLQSIGQWLSSVPDKFCLHEKASPVRDRMAAFGPPGARVVELACSYGWCRSEGTGWPCPPGGTQKEMRISRERAEVVSRKNLTLVLSAL